MLVSVASSGFEIAEMQDGWKMLQKKEESEAPTEKFEKKDDPSLSAADGVRI